MLHMQKNASCMLETLCSHGNTERFCILTFWSLFFLKCVYWLTCKNAFIWFFASIWLDGHLTWSFTSLSMIIAAWFLDWQKNRRERAYKDEIEKKVEKLKRRSKRTKNHEREETKKYQSEVGKEERGRERNE